MKLTLVPTVLDPESQIVHVQPHSHWPITEIMNSKVKAALDYLSNFAAAKFVYLAHVSQHTHAYRDNLSVWEVI